jgi:hypothetical protein
MGVTKYYDLRKVLSYNAAYNFIIGARGKGKTYQAKLYVIKQYLRTGNMFISLRRFKTELAGRGTFFADIAHEFPKLSFRVVGNTAQVCKGNPEDKTAKWETMGFFYALSNAQSQKGVSFHRVTTIIFDEFLIDKGSMHYLPNEANAFNDFYSTVDRYADKTKVFFLANSVSITNPYFLEYDIAPEKGSELIRVRDGFILVHIIDDEAFTAEVYKTRFGAFIKGSEYAQYAVQSQFSDNHTALVDDKTPIAQYHFTLQTKNGVVSVWLDHSNRIWYIQDNRPKHEKFWTLDPSKMEEGRYLVFKTDKTLQILRSAYAQGMVRFSSPKARNALLPIMNR